MNESRSSSGGDNCRCDNCSPYRQSNYFVGVKDCEGDWQTHKVHKDVYIYIKQLENAVMEPERSKLKDLYPERFLLTFDKG